MNTTKIIKTLDQDTIKQWTEDRNGVPTKITQTTEGRVADPLEIYFNDESTEMIMDHQQISWEEFFTIMDNHNLAFAYEENGDDDRYHEFIPRSV